MYDKTSSTSKLLQLFQDSIFDSDFSRETDHRDKDLRSMQIRNGLLFRVWLCMHLKHNELA